jgi:hypothetical protein
MLSTEVKISALVKGAMYLSFAIPIFCNIKGIQPGLYHHISL